jgi:hypothetical protein
MIYIVLLNRKQNKKSAPDELGQSTLKRSKVAISF